MEWCDLPSVLLPETLIQEIKNLVSPNRLLSQIGYIECKKEELENSVG
jgi:hypothetical protein